MTLCAGKYTGPARPQLVPVLAALTYAGEAFWQEAVTGTRSDGIRLDDTGAAVHLVPDPPRYMTGRWSNGPWSQPDALAAHAQLVRLGLWPPLVELATWWWCARCDGTGRYNMSDDPSAPASCRAICPWCNPSPATTRGYDLHPSTRADLVAVASLGVPAVTRAASIAGELGAGPIVWRVMPAAALQELHCREEWAWYNAEPGEPPTMPQVFAALRTAGFKADYWPAESEARRVTPALTELAALGFRLLACGPERVVLGVESL